MNRNWKIAIVVLYLGIAWARFSPAIPWTIDAKYWGDRSVANGWCSEYRIIYEWSWWSFRFTDVHPVCPERDY